MLKYGYHFVEEEEGRVVFPRSTGASTEKPGKMTRASESTKQEEVRPHAHHVAESRDDVCHDKGQADVPQGSLAEPGSGVFAAPRPVSNSIPERGNGSRAPRLALPGGAPHKNRPRHQFHQPDNQPVAPTWN